MSKVSGRPKHFGERVALAAKIVEIVALIFGILISSYGFKIWMEEREARYWQLLTTRASGNSGKVEAIEYLNKLDDLDGTDLSCVTMGSRWINSDLECESGAYLVGVHLANSGLYNVNFSGAVINDATFEKSNLQRANFSKAELQNTKISQSDLSFANFSGVFAPDARFENLTFAETDFSKAFLYRAEFILVDSGHADFSGTNLSAAKFSGASPDRIDFEGAWYWHGFVPTGLSGVTLDECSGNPPQTLFTMELFELGKPKTGCVAVDLP